MIDYIEQGSETVKINFEGSLFVHHSLGMVNRELLSELIKEKSFDISHIQFEPDQFTPDSDSKYASLLSVNKKAHTTADVHIRHRWPPDFSLPSSGKFVLMQPWEYGSLPVMWCEKMNEVVDEIWVYTSYLKMCYIRSGVPQEKIQVIPCGIDPQHFTPQKKPSEWIKKSAEGRYCFLFNGGTTLRKGADVLVNAYLSEFRADEPVCLVIKDSKMYGKALAEKIIQLSYRNDIAKIIYTSDNIPHDDLPGLYTASDCYVHPYRAEGYGLPVAEALACGKPVIVTGGGASLDYVEPDQAFFVKCTCEKMKEKSVSGLQTVDYPFWLVPDMIHLQSVMRYVFNNREFAEKRGMDASRSIREKHTWNYAAMRIKERIFALAGNREKIPLESMLAEACSYFDVADYRRSTELFNKIIQLHGEIDSAYDGLGKIAFCKRNYVDACNYFKHANLVKPGKSEILRNWFDAAKIIGQTRDLIAPLRRALEVNPTDFVLTQLDEEIKDDPHGIC